MKEEAKGNEDKARLDKFFKGTWFLLKVERTELSPPS